MKSVSGASRLIGFDKPTVWSTMTPLAVKTKSVNLGQGFPSWNPPEFFRKFLQQAATTSSHQYTRAFGSLTLTQSIAKFHQSRGTYKGVNHQTDIVTVNGGVEGLYCSFLGLVNEGQEVLLFDPSYDCYRPQIQMAGGKTIALKLQPKNPQSKQQIATRCKEGFKAGEEDDWVIDYEEFEKSINDKTKVLLLNNPHNPIGKVFNYEELNKLADILKKYPKIIVVEDNVYEGVTFDDMYDKPLPKMAFIEGMYDRTVSVYSAGKIFAATGVRSGWVIGPAPLIKAIRSVHQYTVFCAYNVVENCVSKSLDTISQPDSTYLNDYATKLTNNRNLLIQNLLDCPYDFDMWIPKGGYFIMADISKCAIMEKYMKDEEGNPRTKDYAFSIQLANEKGVVCIPCSPFYSQEDSHYGERYVRFAFCKDQEMIIEAGKRLSK